MLKVFFMSAGSDGRGCVRAARMRVLRFFATHSVYSRPRARNQRKEMGCVQRPNCSLSDMQVTHANSVVFIISASSQ